MTNTLTTTRVTGQPNAGTYRVDPTRSIIAFTTRHRFGTGGVAGSFGLQAAEIRVEEPLAGSTVDATATAGSFTTENAKRDKHVHSAAFLDVAEHPVISFHGDRLTEVDGSWVLSGQLSVRGQTAPLELHIAEVHVAGSTLTVRATGRVDRYAHGITKMKGMAGRYLDLDITALADRA